MSIPSKAATGSTTPRDNLVATYHNRNKALSKVMGTAVVSPKEGLQGVYAASMTTGTSRVNW